MIVKNIETIRAHIPLSKSSRLERLQPFLDTAEDELKRIIGTEMYSELEQYVRGNTNTYYDAVLKFIDKSLANRAYYLGFDIMNAVISDQGMHRVETEDGSKKALFQRQEENIKSSFRITAYRNIDKALEYMEQNKSEFSQWAESAEYTLALRNFINSTSDYMKYYDINNSRLLFQKLRTYQTLVEDFEILPAIGSDFFEELKSQIAGDSLTPENVAFLPYIQKAVAQLAVYYAGAKFNFMLADFGFQDSSTLSNTDNYKQSTHDADILSRIINQAKDIGKRYLNTAVKYLQSNINNYRTYAGSNAYISDSLDRSSGTDKIIVL